MKKNKELKWLILGTLFLSVCGLVIAYISLSTSLNIKEVNHFWKVEILNVEVDTDGKTSASNVNALSTSLNDFDISFNGKGTATYKFEVKNSGEVDAVLRSINYGRPICSDYNDSINCDNVSYKLVYLDGREVLTGDVVNGGTHMGMKLIIEFNGNNNSFVKFEDLNFILLYEQV